MIANQENNLKKASSCFLKLAQNPLSSLSDIFIETPATAGEGVAEEVADGDGDPESEVLEFTEIFVFEVTFAEAEGDDEGLLVAVPLFTLTVVLPSGDCILISESEP